MNARTASHFVFVDFENVPAINLDLLSGHPVVVLLFLGLKSKLKADLVEQITRLPCEVRLIKVGLTKKNALDFVLTYHLGATMACCPTGVFHVITGDKDFDPIIRHLAMNGMIVSKLGSVDQLPFLATQPKPPVKSKAGPEPKKPADERSAKIIAWLKDPASSMKPSTEKALLSRIKNDLGKEGTEMKVAELAAELKELGVISADEKGRVTYR